MPDRQPLSGKSADFSAHDLCVLITACFVTTLPRVPPFNLGAGMKSPGWAVTLAAVPIGTALVWMFYRVISKRPDKALPALMEELLGKWPARAAFIFLAAIVFAHLCLSLRLVSERFVVSTYLHSPLSFFALFIALISAYVARGSLQSIARLGTIVAVAAVLLVTAVMALALGDLQGGAVRLPSPRELPQMAGKLPGELSVYALLLMLGFLSPAVAKKETLRKPVTKLAAGLGLLTALSVFVTLGVLGPVLSGYFADPFFAAVRAISSFHRPESFLILIWGTPCVIFMAAMTRVLLTLMGAAAGKPEPDPRLAVPVMGLVLAASLTLGHDIYHIYGLWGILRDSFVYLVIILPVTLFAAGKIGRKPRKAKNTKSVQE